MDKKVYIIFEAFGNCETYISYPLKAYLDKEKAYKECERMNKQVKNWEKKMSKFYNAHLNEFDDEEDFF